MQPPKACYTNSVSASAVTIQEVKCKFSFLKTVSRNPLSAHPTKWSNKLYFVGLALKGLSIPLDTEK